MHSCINVIPWPSSKMIALLNLSGVDGVNYCLDLHKIEVALILCSSYLANLLLASMRVSSVCIAMIPNPLFLLLQ